MHNDPCDNYDGAFDGPPLPAQSSTITFRVSYMLDPGDGLISRETFEHTNDDMGDALSTWMRTNPRFVIACTIADHPLMHARAGQCESVLGGGRCILKDGHRGAHEFS